MLTLENFETHISSAILQRGKQYYQNQAVVSLEETGEDTWQAEVEGSQTYQVELTLKKGNEITDYFCDCPYDGETCKHTVAVFFALREQMPTMKSKRKEKKSGKNIFENLLQSITAKEYQDFIRTYAQKHKDFKTEFELYFASKDERIDVAKKYVDLISKMIRKHSNRGFIDYRASFTLAREVDKLLGSGSEFISKNNFKDAFTVSRVVLKAMMEAITQSDDSAGNLGGTIFSAVELMGSVAEAEKAAIELKEQMFDFLKEELNNKIYFDYGDFGYQMLDIFQSLAIGLNKSNKFLQFIDAQILQLTGRYDDYRRDTLRTLKIEFLEATGKSGEAQKMVQQNLDIVEVRQGEVNKAIEKKDYIAAKKLIGEGITIAQGKDHPGTVAAWERELLRIAYLEKDTDTIRHYTRHFAFDRGFTLEYYKQWKATYNQQEWKQVIEKYISDTIKWVTDKWANDKNKFWHPLHPPLLQILAPIYIQEGYWERLLALVQKENGLETVLQFHTYLAPHYPDELLQMYLPAFEKYGQKADGRSAYADLARKMIRVMKDIPKGKDKIKAIAQNLKEQFPRRPAMLEELNKVLSN
ncbi:hypothetical protein GXP67_31130 [Rhodocytophaga rosea]|uniref:SWIM-type domain-containing protein n=1 Tax=Rhodocytophaga rosea TaxID=2704465 RepID=A0A6C0GRU5_9BACT|nr:SWIM zinc finger family protein [Rhodocytophaga rosea]QHT70786.1 hypothetical protein GXP67_31130 [Rhodocytophaga rosea]